MQSLVAIFQAIRACNGLAGGIGFLHPIVEDRVTISAHGCASHSWSCRIGAVGSGGVGVVNNTNRLVAGGGRKVSAPLQHSATVFGSTATIAITANTGSDGRKLSAPPRFISGVSTLPRVGNECPLPACPDVCWNFHTGLSFCGVFVVVFCLFLSA